MLIVHVQNPPSPGSIQPYTITALFFHVVADLDSFFLLPNENSLPKRIIEILVMLLTCLTTLQCSHDDSIAIQGFLYHYGNNITMISEAHYTIFNTLEHCISVPDHCLSFYFAYQSSCGCAVWWP